MVGGLVRTPEDPEEGGFSFCSIYGVGRLELEFGVGVLELGVRSQETCGPLALENRAKKE